MTLSLAALVGTGTSARANGLDHNLVTTPVPVSLNTPAPRVVPMTGAMVEPEVPVPDAPVLPAILTPDDDDDDFGSLAEAVAAQDVEASGDALRCLAGAIYFESKGEPLSGQLAVAEVILNRARSGRFPPDVCGVVTQRGQFSFVRGGRIPPIDEARKAWRTAVAVARVALDEAWETTAGSALYFNARGRSPGANTRRIAAIGNHVFYR